MLLLICAALSSSFCSPQTGKEIRKIADRDRKAAEKAAQAKAAALRDDDNVFDVSYENQVSWWCNEFHCSLQMLRVSSVQSCNLRQAWAGPLLTFPPVRPLRHCRVPTVPPTPRSRRPTSRWVLAAGKRSVLVSLRFGQGLPH